METKTEKIKHLLHQGDIKLALAIAKTFRFGFTKSEKRTVSMAYEILAGGIDFYRQLGIDTNSVIKSAELILCNKYKVSKG